MQRLLSRGGAVGLFIAVLLGSSGGRATAVIRQADRADWDAALATAVTEFNGFVRAPGEDCSQNNPDMQTCVYAEPRPMNVDNARRGIANFAIGDPAGVGGALVAFARDTAGGWHHWFDYQNTVYQVLGLPGEARVCAEGDSLNARSGPARDASVVATLPDNQAVMVQEFVFTEFSSRQPSGAQLPGYGWYHLSDPVEGWAYSKYLSDASLPDCTVRNARENGR